jgi:hypothetical protein
MIILLLSWIDMGGEVVLVECGNTSPERIFSCNHQRTPGSSKSRSLFVKRPSNTQECRTMSALGDVASRNLVGLGAGIRRRAMSAKGKTKLDLMRLEPKL